jgi:hypothetical protein
MDPKTTYIADNLYYAQSLLKSIAFSLPELFPEDRSRTNELAGSLAGVARLIDNAIGELDEVALTQENPQLEQAGG